MVGYSDFANIVSITALVLTLPLLLVIATSPDFFPGIFSLVVVTVCGVIFFVSWPRKKIHVPSNTDENHNTNSDEIQDIESNKPIIQNENPPKTNSPPKTESNTEK
jgi:hypothetical protein